MYQEVDDPDEHGDGDEESEGETTVAADADPPWKSNPAYLTGPNSPTKYKSNSDVWIKIKRLLPGHPMVEKGFTHVCIEVNCGKFLRLTKPKGKGYWTNTKAREHLKIAHPASSGKPGVEREAHNQVFPVSLFMYILSLK